MGRLALRVLFVSRAGDGGRIQKIVQLSLCEFPLKNRTTRVVLKNEISMKSRVERTTVKVGVEILYRWVGGP